MRRVGTCLSTLVLLFGCAIWPLAAHQLVAPGTVTPFRGGGGGARGPTRWGMVQEFPAGFFVAGSSIRALNGLYDLTRAPPGVSHAFHHAYRNDRSNWLMGYVSAKDEGYPAVGGEATEWVIIDNKWRDRFGHKGDTYLPGVCGARVAAQGVSVSLPWGLETCVSKWVGMPLEMGVHEMTSGHSRQTRFIL